MLLANSDKNTNYDVVRQDMPEPGLIFGFL